MARRKNWRSVTAQAVTERRLPSHALGFTPVPSVPRVGGAQQQQAPLGAEPVAAATLQRHAADIQHRRRAGDRRHGTHHCVAAEQCAAGRSE